MDIDIISFDCTDEVSSFPHRRNGMPEEQLASHWFSPLAHVE